jgi:hypothetical protein
MNKVIHFTSNGQTVAYTLKDFMRDAESVRVRSGADSLIVSNRIPGESLARIRVMPLPR